MVLPVMEHVKLLVLVLLHLAVNFPVPPGLILQTLVCPRLGVSHLLLQLMDPGQEMTGQ